MEQYAIALYLIIGSFFAGRDYVTYGFHSESWWRHILFLIVLAVLTPIERALELAKHAGSVIDKVFQFRFYYLYFRGGFKNLDPNRLYNLDQMLFAKEYLRPKSPVTWHYQFVIGLIFKQNSYSRRKWRIVSNKVEEVQ